ncbi:MAG: hypothetical protein K2P78_11860 [Gemmataceae bacterium]|nr:hypothetical protein [Gemmataceae bacterium]
MRVVRVLAKTDPDGRIRLSFPGGEPGSLYDLALILVPHQEPSDLPTPEELGWPDGYFEKTAGVIDDDTFVRHPQGEYEQRESLD